MTYDIPPQSGQGKSPQDEIAWLLEQFAATEPGVQHALLASRDGIKLTHSSELGRDAADALAAALSGLSSLAANIPGLSGRGVPVRQVLVERDDCLVFLVSAGATSAFPNQPLSTGRSVDTVLGVIATPDANPGKIGFEMQRLVQRFAPYMVTAVRQGDSER
jgi:predicted regulator of Ras-like GTPase activity (Roadblock/LC7/MglB family)